VIYKTLVADPPWPGIGTRIGIGGRRRRVTLLPYSLMDLEAIADLPVRQLADDDAHLFLWCTRRGFREGWAAWVARAWGFEPIGEIIWGLRNPGMGTVLGNDHEPVLVARRGDIKFNGDTRMGGVHFWRQLYDIGKVHSAKPEGFLDFVEQISPGPYVELFARRHRMGWDVWGDQSANTAVLAV
jgi:N6-adenosine-specific RNA methylase IME4